MLDADRQKALGAYFTPEWASIEIVERYFPNLHAQDLVLEPSCGRGAFLKAIPAHVPAFGVEIDPLLAAEARLNTGRNVICGDFTMVRLPEGITTIIGNPPFEATIIERFLKRSTLVLPDFGHAGFILPAYIMQTPRRVTGWLDNWSVKVELLPRTLFPRLSLPLLFVLFTRDGRRNMVGFALYDEACDVDRMTDEAKDVLQNGRPRKGLWRALVEEVMQRLGGEAHLSDIYHAIEPRRPTATNWWKEKVRQVLQFHFEPLGDGRWRVPGGCYGS